MRWYRPLMLMGARKEDEALGFGFAQAIIRFDWQVVETGGAVMLFMATGLGVPDSTTHTITGAIVGVGAARRAPPCAGTWRAASWWRGS